ncbi:carboxymuconolactone decarboxylase family protein [Actinomadura livida]|uniref:Carboxymuconolactone decarboxylase family protein n=1 Tax=Actinomadura livida TaxID=79909 RepID=A0A7W7ID13_9ACTN|nr:MULTISPECIES: carboxymuconolactone decarboxylase family protein [Actinomadura]MBB4774766.1 putative peroxidase-related enzyme [Actinomadura catellatispora]GGU06116.1 carboxymuconolactone decarboxylase [Actinomadura livida]
MPHIPVPKESPGTFGLFQFRPETAVPLLELCEVLLRADNALTRGEREMIAGYVSQGNSSEFCRDGHFTIAALQMEDGFDVVRAVREMPDEAPISAKMKALLRIAEKVRIGGRSVLGTDVDAARDAGATDVEIHDTVLIAAAFSMFNRYADGLDAVVPENPDFHDVVAQRVVDQGYSRMARMIAEPAPAAGASR